jgi:transcriptional regulator with GAF, ATPase, and Fis domain
MGVTVDVTERKLNEERLEQALQEVGQLRNQLEMENIYLREQLGRDDGQDAIVGESKPVLEMIALAQQVAPTDSTVLITGETGTGKELLAQAIHSMSPRKARAMIKVNCAALPAALIEGELFGREKGAYTGAMTRQSGRFEVASGSTIFLDEIGELPLGLQSKLLRVLQDGQFERLGSNKTLTVDVRVVAATNRDLTAMVREGEFREDLFHRLNVFPIEVPPLRERKEDIPLLAWKMVEELNSKMGRAVDRISKSTMERLKHYAWPGNIRELHNKIERAMIVSTGKTLKVHLPEQDPTGTNLPATLEEVERAHVLNILEGTGWRISGPKGAAEILGLLPTTLHARMKKLGLSRPAR